MKKTILPLLMTVCLCGCGFHYRQINCESITVVNADRTERYTFVHKEGFDQVYEFVSLGGDVIYADSIPLSPYIKQTGNPEYVPIKAYKSKGAQGYTEYTYSSCVGPIGTIHNHYVHEIDKWTIETELIYNRSAMSYPQFREMEGAEEAYKCASKTHYYHLNGGDTVYLDTTPQGLKCHFYQTFDETYEITYSVLE